MQTKRRGRKEERRMIWRRRRKRTATTVNSAATKGGSSAVSAVCNEAPREFRIQTPVAPLAGGQRDMQGLVGV